MKITALTDALNILNRVRESGDGKSRQQGQQKEQKKDQESSDGQESFEEVSAEKVGQAIESFQKDASTQAHGLTASAVGNGPGLRVVLKDGSGAIVRQLTGQEFLELRKAASKDGRTRGKILDQKL